jgi:hypothetical protein
MYPGFERAQGTFTSFMSRETGTVQYREEGRPVHDNKVVTARTPPSEGDESSNNLRGVDGDSFEPVEMRETTDDRLTEGRA